MNLNSEQIVTDALSNLYAELGIIKEIGAASIIYGNDEGVNSLSLVRLIVDVEDAVFKATGHTIVLADDRSLSMKNSPFYSVETMAKYLNTLLHERA